MKKIFKLFPFALISGITASSLLLCSCEDNNQKTNFNTCGWSEIAKACNNLENGIWTEEQFIQHFCFGKKQAKSLNDFVGEKRNLKIISQDGYEVDHEIIVVGVNQDTYNQNNETHNATITFQFNNLLSDNDYYFTISWLGGKKPIYNYNYWNSPLENALNSEDDDVVWCWNDVEHRSVRSMIEDSDLEHSWASSIKAVSRRVQIYDETQSRWETKEKSVKIFLPTLSNIYSSIGLKANGSIVKPYWLKYYAEGQSNSEKQYAYYKSDIGDNPVNATDQYLSLQRIGCYPAHRKWHYWLSTPSLSLYTNAWTVLMDGCLDAMGTNYENAIAPCFCL